ncbi:MAG: 2-oxoglutarate ferredoxin oxidoreductase subunit alpha, partial [Bacteroidota bacterium]|nr:2-oxoglutarate ferredoxin oxidoreductase subunit alpha [Bacteroidota bacterium]
AHAHLRYVRPFPRNLGDILKNYDHILVPEINNGQLIKIIRDKFLVDAKGYNKVMGIPITKGEIINEVKKMIEEE